MAGFYCYFAHSLAVKLSVLALYYRIFGIKRSHRIWIYILAAAMIALIAALCILQALLCIPIGRYFDPSIPGTCKSSGLLVIIGETPSSFLDFAMVALAIVMIRPLHLSSRLKWRLTFLFGLGVMSVISRGVIIPCTDQDVWFRVGILGFIKVALTYSGGSLCKFIHPTAVLKVCMLTIFVPDAFSTVAMLGCIQMFLSLLCCCLPVFNFLLPASASWGQFLQYATFGLISLNRINTHASDNRRSRLQPNDKPRGLEHLYEDISTKALTYPEAVHRTETHAMSDFQGGYTDSPSIRVQRQFDVV